MISLLRISYILIALSVLFIVVNSNISILLLIVSTVTSTISVRRLHKSKPAIVSLVLSLFLIAFIMLFSLYALLTFTTLE